MGNLITSIILFLGGVIAAASFIIKRRPDAKEMIDKILPYQGIIGLILLVSGIWEFLSTIGYIGFMFRYSTFWALVVLLAITVDIVLGFLLGYGLIAQYLLKGNEEALEKGEMIKARLIKYQTQAGLAAIVLSVLWLMVGLGIVRPWVL
ncbi:MAG: hypothetical protein NW226_04145 [Microscillaceae bacterium]|nr:hypothetical protein [Microscillaceae bacterium]